jgi:hypothetical protein
MVCGDKARRKAWGVFQRLKAALESSFGGVRIRRALVVALLLAFALQTQLSVSHFHLAGPAGAAALSDSGKDPSQDHQKKLPGHGGCFICQQLAGVHGTLIQVAVALYPLDLISTKVAVPRNERAPLAVARRSWQSRAPPL